MENCLEIPFMKKMALFLFLAWIVVPICTVPGHCQEPASQGRTLGEWAAVAGRASTQEERTQAISAIRQIGANAVPFILNEVSALTKEFNEVGLSSFVSSHEIIHRRFLLERICEALGPMGASAAPSLSRLVKEDKDPAFIAAQCLARLDPRAADPLFAMELAKKSWNTRASIASETWYLGTNAVAVRPALVQCLKEESAGAENAATVALCVLDTMRTLGNPTEAEVRTVAGCLIDADVTVRLTAIKNLEQSGALAHLAIAQLTQLSTDDPNPRVRAAAHQATQRLGKGGIRPPFHGLPYHDR